MANEPIHHVNFTSRARESNTMQIAAIGVGGAGCRVVNALWRDNERRDSSYLADARAFDTDTDVLNQLGTVPSGGRVSFGGFEAGGNGTDGDRTAGTAAVDEDKTALKRSVDDMMTSAVEAVLLVAGLGGGTGSGATPHLVRVITETYDLPVYTVSILPAHTEGNHTETNAQAGLRSLREVTTCQLVFDNDAWIGSGESVTESRQKLNTTLVQRIAAVFSAGEATRPDTVAESVVDASEIINTLAGGDLATIGYMSQQVRDQTTGIEKWIGNLLGTNEEIDTVESIKAVETTIRRATMGKLTLECDVESVSRGLLIVGGPPKWLNRQAIADGREWLSQETDAVQIRSGDVPQSEGTHIAVTVLLTGVDSDRISTLRSPHH